MRVWINDVHKREIFFFFFKNKENLSSLMMNDFDFEHSRRQSCLSPRRIGRPSWSNRSILFLPFALLAREGLREFSPNTRYQLGWAIVLLGVGTTEREWGDEEKVLYTKHSRERFFIVAHRESEQAGSLSYMKEKGTFFFSFGPSSIAATGPVPPLPVSLDAPLVRSDQKEFANPLLEERT